jgi:ribosomal-protein-alanine N-acetyltransferase
MTPEALAALHAQAFACAAPRPWTAGEFAALLAAAATIALLRPEGFALGRAAADEAELLTLAVAPAARRRGLGRALVAGFEAAAAARGARAAFLEVEAGNAAARALYASLGWRPAGLRRGYYARVAGPAADAIVLRKVIRPPHEKA